jgi:hypothetical protein
MRLAGPAAPLMGECCRLPRYDNMETAFDERSEMDWRR